MAGALLELGVRDVGRRPKGQPAPEGKGVLVRVSKDAVAVVRRLSGFLEMPMSDVVSQLILEHGKPKLMKLMNAAQEAMEREERKK